MASRAWYIIVFTALMISSMRDWKGQWEKRRVGVEAYEGCVG